LQLFPRATAKVADEILDHFMIPLPLLCRGVKSVTILGDKPAQSQKTVLIKDPDSKNQAKKMEKLLLIERKNLEKAQKKAGTKAEDVESKAAHNVDRVSGSSIVP
jgi:hypothetical protein